MNKTDCGFLQYHIIVKVEAYQNLFCKKLFRLELVTLIFIQEITKNHNY